MKKFLRHLIAGAVLMLAAGCTSPESRIRNQQSEFDAWPSAARDKIRAGHVDVGFTPAMVRVALGEPDRVFARTTEKGSDEVWVFLDSGPRFSIGIGMGGSSGASAYGGGVILSEEGFRADEVLRVVFELGRVVAVEARRR